MKKRIIILAVVATLALLSMLFAFTACNGIISLENLEIVCSEESGTYEIGKFDYDDYSLLLTYSDGSNESLPLTEDLISEYDRLQLKSPGQHTITVQYENKKAEITVTVTRKQTASDEGDGTVAPYLPTMTVKYDGKSHTLSVQGDVPPGATILYPQGNTFTEAGMYPVTATVQADGYDTISLSAMLTIERSEYVFEDFAIVADYGTGKDGTPLTAFVYDGLSHGVKMVGSYPAELGEPKFQIVNTDEKTANYTNGYSAIDAGHYHVIATFDGDEKNYFTDNLTFECYFEITKKPISVEVLSAISFEDLTIDYDAKPHRIDIGKVELPVGISVGYYTEDGVTPFGTRTDVGEYDIIAKFQSDNPNLEIINELKAHLSIQQVNYVNVDLLHIGFLDESTELTYDGTAHELKVFGLNKNVTVLKFVWNKSDNTADDVEITSLTDVLVNDNREPVTYKITAYFNTPADPNHKPVDPITAELKITPAEYTAPQYVFESLLATYNENETYSLSFSEINLPAGMKSVLNYTLPGKAETIPGLPSITCLPYDATNPKQNCGVGIYPCTLSFDYNPNNYINAPESISPITRTLEIAVRSYDAENIITVKNVRAEYAVGVNQLALCGFNEALPDWVSDIYLKLAILEGTEEELYEATSTGTYEYFFRFSYFNGKEMVTVDSASAELKIVGLPIYDRYYSVTYGTTFIYDGVTDCLPNASLDAEVADILSIRCVYSFAETGSTDFVPVYSGAGDKASLMANADCLAYSKKAGSHKFEFTIEGTNFEPLSVSVTLTINPKKLEISHTNWILNSETTVITFDGTDHGNAYTFASEPPVAEAALVTLTPKLLSSNTNGKNPGIDVGEYTYSLVFTSNDKNYYIETEDETYFIYHVKVNPLDASGEEGDEYYPAGFFYYTSNEQNRFRLERVTSDKMNYTSESPIFETVKTYGIKVDENTYTMPQWKYANGNDTPIRYSAADLEMYHWGLTGSSVTTGLINKAFSDDVTVLVLRPDGTTQTFKGLTNHSYSDADDITAEVCSPFDASICGDYVIMMILDSENITYDGSRIFAFRITIKPIEIESNNVLNKATGCSFAGFSSSSIPVAEERTVIDGFKGKPMFLEDSGWFVTGGYLEPDLFVSVTPFAKLQIQKETSYILYCDLNGNVLKFDGFHTVYAFDVLDEDRLNRPGETYTQAGYYYLFIDLGPNAVVKVANGQIIPDLHSFVVRMKVQAKNINASDLVKLKDSNGTTYEQGSTRLYQTDAATVTYKYGSSAIPNVDTVSGTQAFAGLKVRTFETLYNGKVFGLEILPSLPNGMKNSLTFTLTYETNAFTAGGAALGLATSYSNSGLTYDDVNTMVSALYSTSTAKTNGVTSVGLYYVFVTIEGDDLLFDGEKTFIVTVKIDRQENESDYKYSYQSQTYDLRTATPFAKESVAWNQIAGKSFTLSDTIKTAIKKQTGITTVQTDSITPPETVGTYSIHAKFTYNTEAYGGLVIEGDYPLLDVTKVKINLSNLSPLGVRTFRQSSVDGQTITNSLQTEIRKQFVALGTDSSNAYQIASRIFSNYSSTFQVYTDESGSNSYVKLSTHGTYWFTPTFHFSTNDTIFQKYDIVAGNSFTQSGNTFTPNSRYKTKIFVDNTTDKGKLFLTQGASTSWYSEFGPGESVTDPTCAVKNAYAFIGYYTESGNDFYNSLLTYMDEDEARAWVKTHVTVTIDSSYEITVTINLGDDASKFDFYINTWWTDGTNPETNKGIGSLSTCSIYSGTVYTFTARYSTKN